VANRELRSRRVGYGGIGRMHLEGLENVGPDDVAVVLSEYSFKDITKRNVANIRVVEPFAG
jgi:hypothetical protein